MNWNEYGAFIIEETKNLLAIDSPSGMTKKAAEHVAARFEALGYAPQTTRKDGVLVCLGGRDRENGLLLEAHMDTLGGMVCQIKANGRLKITPIGGLRAENVETENCRVVTKFDGVIEGTAQLVNASTHVNEKYADTQRTFDTVEIVLDEPVAGLDPLSREEFLGLIRELHAGGRTIVMVSHSMEDLAALSDRILVLSEGRLFRLGTPAEVFADAAALKAVGLGAPAPEAFAASLREVGFTLGRDLYDERTLAADIAAQLAGTPVAAAPDAAVGFAALRAADAVAEGGGDDA